MHGTKIRVNLRTTRINLYLNKTEINCHKCKGKGHYANQCKLPIKKINQIDIYKSDSEEYEIDWHFKVFCQFSF